MNNFKCHVNWFWGVRTAGYVIDQVWENNGENFTIDHIRFSGINRIENVKTQFKKNVFHVFYVVTVAIFQR